MAKINLFSWFRTIGIAGIGQSTDRPTNFYDFWNSIYTNTPRTKINNITDFMNWKGTNRYEFFTSLNTEYPDVWDEYTFYQNTYDDRIYDFKTFYEYAGGSLSSAYLFSIGSGNTTSSLPFITNYNYVYSQSIHTTNILTGQTNNNRLFIGAEINKLFFDIRTASPSATTNVYIGTTTKTSFTGTTDWLPISSMRLIYSGDIKQQGLQTNIITIDPPFIWNGDNIVIAVHKNTPGISSGSFRGTTSISNSSMIYYNNITNPNPSSPPTATSRSSVVPNLYFYTLN